MDLSEELNPSKAVEKTKLAMRDEAVACIFEGAFEKEGALVRADVLVQNRILDAKSPHPRLWNLIEVKSSSSTRPEHVLDISFQKAVLEGEEGGQGLGTLSSVSVMNISSEFVFEGESYENLFEINDVTDQVESFEEIREKMTPMLALLDPRTACPDVETGPQCNKPIACDFKSFCTKNELMGCVAHKPVKTHIVLPEELEDLKVPTLKALLKAHKLPTSGRKSELITRLESYKEEIKKPAELRAPPRALGEEHVPLSVLPRLHKAKADKWKAMNIHDLRDLPLSELSNPLHRRIWKCHVNNENFYDQPGLRKLLPQFAWPRYFMDFEMIQQVIPQVPGSTSREQLPFQWYVFLLDF